MSELLIFVPTYNERDNAPRMARELAALPLDADFLFVDDNSPDGTGKLLDEIKKEIPRLIVHHRSGKLGIGTAHAEAISWAYQKGYKILVTLDCDFTHSPADIPTMIGATEKADIAVGSRWVKRDSLPGWNLLRRAITFFGHGLTKFVLGIPQDASGAFRAYRLDCVPQGIWELIKSRGYSFFFESMFVFNRNNLLVNEIPITLPARTYGNSKMSTQAALNSARYIFELALKNIRCPEQFLLPSPNFYWDSNLADPQNWDAYWNESGETGNPVYEIIAGVYRRIFIKRNLEKAIRSEFAPDSSLLHAGCGSGQVDTELQKEMKINALDISKGALSLYSRNNKNAVAVIHGNIFDLPFPDETFDGIYNLGVMEHFTDNEITCILRQFHRVLKANGKIAFFWPHARASSVLVLRLCHQFLRFAMKSDKKLHPPEISLMQSRKHAQEILAKADFELSDYHFGPSDLWVQAVITAHKKSPHLCN
jgi:dolichol-phosphate mannosyltransferase